MSYRKVDSFDMFDRFMWFELGIFVFFFVKKSRKRHRRQISSRNIFNKSKIVLEHEIVNSKNGLRNLTRCRARVNTAYADDKGAFRFSEKSGLKSFHKFR